MKRLYVIAYRYRDHLEEKDLQELTKKFSEVGTTSGVLAHYTRLDGQGGFLVQEMTEDPAKDFEVTIRYGPWMTFEILPVATIEEAFPVIQTVYG
jgi:hypothetical protein